MRRRIDLSVYVVLDPVLCAGTGMAETARLAAEGGATAVQLRHKTATAREMVEIGRAVQAALAGTGAAFVVNDDVEAARELGADVLHIGQEDMGPERARALIGPDMILGLSVETEAAARAVDAELVDYAGAGPVFATPTKPDHKPAVGIDGLARLVELSPVPAVAIGGLKAVHAAQVIGTGAEGLAVVSEICGRDDPKAATMALARAVREAKA